MPASGVYVEPVALDGGMPADVCSCSHDGLSGTYAMQLTCFVVNTSAVKVVLRNADPDTAASVPAGNVLVVLARYGAGLKTDEDAVVSPPHNQSRSVEGADSHTFFSVDVFTGGVPGYWQGQSIAMPCYRIPSVVHVTGTQTLVAFAEARPDSSECARTRTRLADSGRSGYAGYMIGMARSTSGGRTWSNITFITEQSTDCGHQPTAVYDRVRKQIVLQLRCAGKGFGFHMGVDKGVAHPYQMLSTDNGLSWGKRTPLWQQLPPTFQQLFPGPGLGLQLRSGAKAGRLLFCGWDQQLPSKTKEEENERDAVWFSDDGGSTYQL
eukprot:SAG11_NODE_6023_length_1407_cov_1.706422_1_plen_322_part_10